MVPTLCEINERSAFPSRLPAGCCLSAGHHRGDELPNQRWRRSSAPSAFKVQPRPLTGHDRNSAPSHASHVSAINREICDCKTLIHISDRSQWRVISQGGKGKNNEVGEGKWPTAGVWTETLLYFIRCSPPDSYCPAITG